MSDLERLHAIIDSLPPEQIQALLALLDTVQPTNETEFLRRIAAAPEEEVDAETAEQVLAAENEGGETISHDELKQRLGL